MRTWCRCGRKIPEDKIALAYATGKLLYCTQCHTFTGAVEVGEVAGNLKDEGKHGKLYPVGFNTKLSEN